MLSVKPSNFTNLKVYQRLCSEEIQVRGKDTKDLGLQSSSATYELCDFRQVPNFSVLHCLCFKLQ